MQLSRRNRLPHPQYLQRGGHRLLLSGGWSTKLLRDALFRRAEITLPAKPPPIFAIAEMAHQRRHSTLACVGILHHLVDLRPPACDLRRVCVAPVAVSGGHMIGI